MEEETKQDFIEMIIAMLATILIIIFLITIASAEYSGDSKIINLDKKYDYWMVVGNNTPVIDSINQDEYNFNVTIVFNKYIINETFSIIFFNDTEKIKEIQTTIYSGGGGGSTKYIDRIVEVPKFYDRNVTTTIYEQNKTIEEKLLFQDTGYKFWHIALGLIVGFLICFMLWYFYGNRD